MHIRVLSTIIDILQHGHQVNHSRDIVVSFPVPVYTYIIYKYLLPIFFFSHSPQPTTILFSPWRISISYMCACVHITHVYYIYLQVYYLYYYITHYNIYRVLVYNNMYIIFIIHIKNSNYNNIQVYTNNNIICVYTVSDMGTIE